MCPALHFTISSGQAMARLQAPHLSKREEERSGGVGGVGGVGVLADLVHGVEKVELKVEVKVENCGRAGEPRGGEPRKEGGLERLGWWPPWAMVVVVVAASSSFSPMPLVSAGGTVRQLDS